jgi:hypothetical protein
VKILTTSQPDLVRCEICLGWIDLNDARAQSDVVAKVKDFRRGGGAVSLASGAGSSSAN